MDIEELADALIEAYEEEPEYDFPNQRENQWAHAQGVRARFITLLEDFTDHQVPNDSDLAQADDDVEELTLQNLRLEDENTTLRIRVAELEAEK